MCAITEGLVVATSVGVVEAMKDQGYCRWNNAIRSIHEHAKHHVKSASEAKKQSRPPSSVSRDEQMKKSEESLRTVMFLSTWGPNS